MRTIPNALAVARGLAVVPVVLLLGDPDLAWWALGVFSVAALTDAVDGPIARRLNAATPLGAFLDPLADKVLVLGTLLALVGQGRVEAWAVAIVVGREALAVVLRSAGVVRGVAIEASPAGKAKTIVQAVAVGGVLLALAMPGYGISVLAAALLGIAIALTLVSGAELVLRVPPLLVHDDRRVAVDAR